MTNPEPLDAIVVGGGPAGSTAALVLARAGRRVRVLERAPFPRFHIGESLLPRNIGLFKELGIAEELKKLPQVPKYGADFVMGHGKSEACFTFDMGILGGDTVAFNVERAPFDALLLDLAGKAGAEIDHGAALRSIDRLEQGDVAVTTSAGERLTARWLIDASGQSTVVGKHLGTRKVLPHLKKVAYFGHFDGVYRREGWQGGSPVIVMCDEGWFWIIPLTETKTSIGLVMDFEKSKKIGLPPEEMLAWGISRTPALRDRTSKATQVGETHVAADFSYRCEPFSGPGYFLAGDAATFVDPIFSTGVCLGMSSAARAAKAILAIDEGRETVEEAREGYRRFIDESTGAFFKMIYMFYEHSFRELALGGGSPMKLHNAVLSILAGNVFPRPRFPVRWRLKVLSFFVWINSKVRFVPAHDRFSIAASEPAPGRPAPVHAADPFRGLVPPAVAEAAAAP